MVAHTFEGINLLRYISIGIKVYSTRRWWALFDETWLEEYVWHPEPELLLAQPTHKGFYKYQLPEGHRFIFYSLLPFAIHTSARTHHGGTTIDAPRQSASTFGFTTAETFNTLSNAIREQLPPENLPPNGMHFEIGFYHHSIHSRFSSNPSSRGECTAL